MTELQQEIIEGIMIGVRDASSNLFRLANTGERDADVRAKNGIKNVKATAELMLELTKRVFEED